MQLSAVKAIRKRQLNCIKGLENSNVIAFRASPQHNKRVSSTRLKTLRKTATTYSPTCPSASTASKTLNGTAQAKGSIEDYLLPVTAVI